MNPPGLIPPSEGFGELHSLKELNLDGCIKLEALPAGLNAFPPACCSHHRSLHPPFTLNHPRTAWPNPLLSEGFGELRSLQKLELSYCNRLGSLPAGLHIIHACCSHRSPLPPFTLNHPRNTRRNPLLSEGFGELASLADLSLTFCHALAKNEGTYAILSEITTLTKLSLAGCDMVSLPEGICHASPR